SLLGSNEPQAGHSYPKQPRCFPARLPIANTKPGRFQYPGRTTGANQTALYKQHDVSVSIGPKVQAEGRNFRHLWWWSQNLQASGYVPALAAIVVRHRAELDNSLSTTSTEQH